MHDGLNELKLNKLSQVAHASVSTLCVAPEFETFFQVNLKFSFLTLLHEKFLQFVWLRAVVFQLNLKYLHEKITEPLRVVV